MIWIMQPFISKEVMNYALKIPDAGFADTLYGLNRYPYHRLLSHSHVNQISLSIVNIKLNP